MVHRTWMRWTCVALGLCALGASGCGGSSGSQSNDKGGEEITLGEIADLTGPGANTYGVQLNQGEVIAVDEVNESGFLGDTTFKLDTQDEAADVNNGVTIYEKFVRDGIKYIMGDAFSPTLNAVGAKITSDGVLYMSAAAGTTVEAPGQVYRVNDSLEGLRTEAKYASEQLGSERLGMIIESDYVAFPEQAKVFKQAIEELGGPEVVSTQNTVGTQTDFSTVLTNLKKANVDTILMLVHPERAGNIMEQMQSSGDFQGVHVLGPASWSEQVTDIAGKAAAGAVFPQAWVVGQKGSDAFTVAYQKKFKDAPITWSAMGHDMVWLLAVAMKQVQEAGDEVDPISVGKAIPAASKSKEFADHALIEGLTVTEDGVPHYPSTLAVFDENGKMGPLDDSSQ